MVINWTSLIIALFFGAIPPLVLIKGDVRFLFFEDLWTKAIRPDPSERRRRRWWKLPLVWIDPVRGFATAWYGMEAFTKPLRASGISVYYVLGATAALLMFCLWMQTVGRRSFNETISPMGFLTGMMLFMLPHEVSIPVLVVGFASVVAVRDYVYGYYAAALLCAGFGYVFMGLSLNLLTPMALLLLPVVVNWLRGTQLVVPVRC